MITDASKREMLVQKQHEKQRHTHERGLWGGVKEVYDKFNTKDGLTQAAALAFYTGLSLAPLLTLLTLVTKNLFGRDAKESIARAFEQVMGTRAAGPIREILEPASTNLATGLNLSGIISLVVLAFSATAVFGQLQSALNYMWDVEAIPTAGIWGYLRKRVLSFGMLLSIMFLLLISLVVSAAIQAAIGVFGFEAGWILSCVNNIASLLIFWLLFAMMFRYVPDVRIDWRDVWAGAALSSLLFVMGKFALGIYLGRGSYQSSYGAALGSFVAMLVWVYYSAVIVFIGAELTRVWARRHGHHVKPEEHAVRVREEVKPVPA